MSNTIQTSNQAAMDVTFSARRHMRLRLVLPIVFFLLISVVAMLIIFIMQRSVTSSIETLAKVVMTRVSQRVMENTSHYLESAASVVQMNAMVLQKEPIQTEEEDRAFLAFFDRTSRKQLNLFPYFGLIYQGDHKGNHWLNKREQDGTIHERVITRKDDSPASKQAFEKFSRHPKATEQDRQAIAEGIAPYVETQWYEQDQNGKLVPKEKDPIKVYDPRARPWYQGAKENNKPFWTDVYAWEDKYRGVISRQVGITVSAPMMRHGRLVGVSGIDISLQAVSNFLRSMEIMKNGQAFILNGKGETVGLSNYTEVLAKIELDGGSVALNHVSKISNHAVAASYQAMRQSLALTKQQSFHLQAGRVVAFNLANQRYYGFYKPFTSDFGLDWTVGVIVPEDDFLGDVKKEVRRSLMVVLASICFMILAGVLIGRMITKPLHGLSEEVERIIQFDLAPTPPLKTRFLELGMISFAFTRMKLELAKMVDTISAHTKTLDWSSEEFANIALTLEDSTQTMRSNMKTAHLALQNMPEQTHSKEVMGAMTQMEYSLNELQNLSQPVIQRAQNVTHIAHALRKALQTFRI